jgi:dihydrodipicolinate synthase/N-acetylneuraminate lyase
MQFLVAIPTPFDRRARVDHARLRAHVLWLASVGVDGFVPTGSTGEFVYLSDREREAVHRTTLDSSMGKPVYPCVWDPSPITTAWLCNKARDNGARGALLPPPLYYELDQPTVLRWYTTIHEATELPLHAYHIPKYVPTPVSEATYAQLHADGRVAGMKDSSGDRHRLARMARAHPDSIWASRDSVMNHARSIDGIAGFVSAAANLWPSLCLRLFRDGDADVADAVSDRVARLRSAGGIQALKGILGMGCRLPLPAPDPAVLRGLPPSEMPD